MSMVHHFTSLTCYCADSLILFLSGCVHQGLGVVCNKEEGFGEEDFVVEFLGEV